jgi:hypothetical protein
LKFLFDRFNFRNAAITDNYEIVAVADQLEITLAGCAPCLSGVLPTIPPLRCPLV